METEQEKTFRLLKRVPLSSSWMNVTYGYFIRQKEDLEKEYTTLKQRRKVLDSDPNPQYSQEYEEISNRLVEIQKMLSDEGLMKLKEELLGRFGWTYDEYIDELYKSWGKPLRMPKKQPWYKRWFRKGEE